MAGRLHIISGEDVPWGNPLGAGEMNWCWSKYRYTEMEEIRKIKRNQKNDKNDMDGIKHIEKKEWKGIKFSQHN